MYMNWLKDLNEPLNSSVIPISTKPGEWVGDGNGLEFKGPFNTIKVMTSQ